MNEQILTKLVIRSSDKDGWLDRQKFAELLVRECADFVSSKADLQSGLGIKTMLKVTGEQLKEHFGVEE
jgi:hypothetical protein